MLHPVLSPAFLLICWGLQFTAALEEPWAVVDWSPATVTFYGGSDASGTMGGACGFGNLYFTGYGVDTAALSQNLFNDGVSCGACYEIKCDIAHGGHSTKWCYDGSPSVTITATNFCPPNPYRPLDGWCNPPNNHFDLSYPAFSVLAERVAGIIPVQYRRVPCVKDGGVRFAIKGNPYFNLVMVSNVAGAGNVVAMAIKGSECVDWYDMVRNWGQNWDKGIKLVGQSLSFKVTVSTSLTLTFEDITGPYWRFGQHYEAPSNFPMDTLY